MSAELHAILIQRAHEFVLIFLPGLILGLIEGYRLGARFGVRAGSGVETQGQEKP